MATNGSYAIAHSLVNARAVAAIGLAVESNA
jgi:hypothetical protein